MAGLSRSSQDSVAAKATADQPGRSRNQRSPPGWVGGLPTRLL